MSYTIEMFVQIGNTNKYWNASENGTTDGEEEKEYNWVMLSLTSIIFLSILGNMLVCLAIIKYKKLQNITNYFLFSLAIADLMVAVLVMPFGVVNNLMGYWSMGLVLCDIWVSLDVLCCTSSILHMCCLFVDRYLAIQNPLKYSRKRKTLRQTVTKITILWILSTMISMPLFVDGLIDPEKVLNDGICAPMTKEFVFYGSVLAFFIPLLIVVITYFLTALILHKKAAQTTGKKNSTKTILMVPSKIVGNTTLKCNHKLDYAINKTHMNKSIETKSLITSPKSESHFLRKNSRRNINEKRAEKVLGIVFLSFVIGWLPFFITNVINATCNLCISNNTLFILFTWLGWSSSMINPLIYTIFSKDFQDAFRNLLCLEVKSHFVTQLTEKGVECYTPSLRRSKFNKSQETYV